LRKSATLKVSRFDYDILQYFCDAGACRGLVMPR